MTKEGSDIPASTQVEITMQLVRKRLRETGKNVSEEKIRELLRSLKEYVFGSKEKIII
jgi:hypothetical protein